MTETLKKHASLRGMNAVSDEANQLSWFPIRTEECQDCTFSLLPKLTEFRRGQSASVTILTDFAALNRLGCRAHIRSLAMTQCAFTMAEILLSLTIIGVVAAITLPSLMANINERTWNTQRKALYARLSQAIAMMPQVGGYGTLTEDENGSVTADTAAETFLTEGLSKVLKINNICDSEHLADCGVPSTINALNGNTAFSQIPKTLMGFNASFNYSKTIVNSTMNYSWVASYSQTDTKAAAFETQNGESVLLYYNPYCAADNGDGYMYVQAYMCANFVYDLNGNKGPNTVGKDVGFVTALYADNTATVAPLPLSNINEALDFNSARNYCGGQNSETRLPNIDELSAMFYNNNLLFSVNDDTFADNASTNMWSNTLFEDGSIRYLHFRTGIRNARRESDTATSWCIQR